HGQRNEFHVLKTVALGARLDRLGLVQESLGFAAGRVVHHQRPQIVVGDVARDFVGQFVVSVFGQERTLLPEGRSGKAGEHREQGEESAHSKSSPLKSETRSQKSEQTTARIPQAESRFPLSAFCFLISAF